MLNYELRTVLQPRDIGKIISHILYQPLIKRNAQRPAQPRRLIVASTAVGCKPVLDGVVGARILLP